MEYLDCECTYFPSMADDDPIRSAYSYAQRLGVREGFVPVLIQADDETLLECLVMNADPEHDADCYEFDLKTVDGVPEEDAGRSRQGRKGGFGGIDRPAQGRSRGR